MISEQPKDQSAHINQTVKFNVGVPETVYPPPHYQWYKKDGSVWFKLDNQIYSYLRWPVQGVHDADYEFSCAVYNEIAGHKHEMTSTAVRIHVGKLMGLRQFVRASMCVWGGGGGGDVCTCARAWRCACVCVCACM